MGGCGLCNGVSLQDPEHFDSVCDCYDSCINNEDCDAFSYNVKETNWEGLVCYEKILLLYTLVNLIPIRCVSHWINDKY